MTQQERLKTLHAILGYWLDKLGLPNQPAVEAQIRAAVKQCEERIAKLGHRPIVTIQTETPP